MFALHAYNLAGGEDVFGNSRGVNILKPRISNHNLNVDVGRKSVERRVRGMKFAHFRSHFFRFIHRRKGSEETVR